MPSTAWCATPGRQVVLNELHHALLDVFLDIGQHAAAQVIDHAHPRAAGQQGFDHVRADKRGSAGY